MEDRSAGEGGYAASGVDEEREQTAFGSRMRPWLAKTHTTNPRVRVLSGVASGYFATVLHIDADRGGPSIALTTDGVGTKILVAGAAGRYEGVGIDCVANNVNDLLCIGADPVALLDYIAVDVIDEDVMEALARGLFQGAELAGISIPGGEIAQVADMLAAPSEGVPGPMFDLVGTAVGLLAPSGEGQGPVILDGSQVAPGDVVIGLRSSGLHSNGYSLARRALFELGGYALDDPVPGSHQTIADALLEPTVIYVPVARALWSAGVPIHGLVNISGGGLLNVLRLPPTVAYRLDRLPLPQPIFGLIAEAGAVGAAEMYATFNMGVGMVAIVPASVVDAVLSVVASVGQEASVIGEVLEASEKQVDLPALALVGRGDSFYPLG